MSEGLRTITCPVRDLTGARVLFGALLGVEPYVDEAYGVGSRAPGGSEVGLDPHGHAKGFPGPVPSWPVSDRPGGEWPFAVLVGAGAEVVQDIQDVGGGTLIASVQDTGDNAVGPAQEASRPGRGTVRPDEATACGCTSCMCNNLPFLCYRADMAAEKAALRLEDQWRDILSVHARTMCEIDRELHPHGVGASDFEMLDILASSSPGPDASADATSDSAPFGQCRVQTIADRIHLSQSALSRLIGRLEREGLVERSICQEDRRGVRVALTRKGRDLHTRVRPLQRAALARMLPDSV